MAKVNKAYSLDPEVWMMLEDYCSASDNWDRKISRSKVVNDAIRWFLSGDVAQLKLERDDIHARWVELVNEKHNSKVSMPKKPWWKQILGLN